MSGDTFMEKKVIPHITGLRGIAVLGIIAFHLGIVSLRGGYLGVDIFFVISGFLITKMVSQEVLHTGRFSFRNFYLRRGRRLLPALFVTLGLTLVFGFLLFTPEDFQRLGDVVWRCPLAVANIYFWKESNYFDVSSHLKPLLHTWSLSVEEQFYLLWPALVLMLLRARRWIADYASTLLLFAASYALIFVFQGGTIHWLNDISPHFRNGASTVFYLMPFRIYEFLIGALTWFLYTRLPGLASDGLSLMGALLVVGSFVYLSDSLVNSASYSLIPCLGAALLIYSGASPVVSRGLNHAILRYTGEISYSLYLLHWPLIVFLRYYKIEDLAPMDKALAFGATFGSAALLNRLVESPFRYPQSVWRLKPTWAFLSAVVACAAGLYFVGVNIDRLRGWTWRVSPEQQKLIADLKDPKQYQIDHFGGRCMAKTAILIQPTMQKRTSY